MPQLSAPTSPCNPYREKASSQSWSSLYACCVMRHLQWSELEWTPDQEWGSHSARAPLKDTDAGHDANPTGKTTLVSGCHLLDHTPPAQQRVLAAGPRFSSNRERGSEREGAAPTATGS